MYERVGSRLLKPMLGAIVSHHLRTTPLIGAAHGAREARATCRVNNLPRARCATSLCSLVFSRGHGKIGKRISWWHALRAALQKHKVECLTHGS